MAATAQEKKKFIRKGMGLVESLTKAQKKIEGYKEELDTVLSALKKNGEK